jgi:metallophosphoesterase (TIGR00282 family)
MKILVIGDIVGTGGCRHLRAKLPSLKRTMGIDLVIANGENSADGNGITPVSMDYLFDSGVDVITTGNHSFRRPESYAVYEQEPYLLRPDNFPPGAPGKGWCVYDMGRTQVCIANIMGTVYMESLDDPFRAADAILKATPDCAVHVFDFHAEATAEKRAMGFYLDGRASIVFGTHTHVQTADECILPQGTGYITDVGMTGPVQSVLGIKPELAIAKMKTKLPVRFANAEGAQMMNCALFTVDERTGKTKEVRRLDIR